MSTAEEKKVQSRQQQQQRHGQRCCRWTVMSFKSLPERVHNLIFQFSDLETLSHMSCVASRFKTIFPAALKERATRSIDKHGMWKKLLHQINTQPLESIPAPQGVGNFFCLPDGTIGCYTYRYQAFYNEPSDFGPESRIRELWTLDLKSKRMVHDTTVSTYFPSIPTADAPVVGSCGGLYFLRQYYPSRGDLVQRCSKLSIWRCERGTPLHDPAENPPLNFSIKNDRQGISLCRYYSDTEIQLDDNSWLAMQSRSFERRADLAGSFLFLSNKHSTLGYEAYLFSCSDIMNGGNETIKPCDVLRCFRGKRVTSYPCGHGMGTQLLVTQDPGGDTRKEYHLVHVDQKLGKFVLRSFGTHPTLDRYSFWCTPYSSGTSLFLFEFGDFGEEFEDVGDTDLVEYDLRQEKVIRTLRPNLTPDDDVNGVVVCPLHNKLVMCVASCAHSEGTPYAFRNIVFALTMER